MNEGLLVSLVLGAAGLGALHSLAPDHWVPFAALARARDWSRRRSATVTALAALAHVSASAVLGILAMVFGTGLVATVGHRLEALAGVGLLVFGLGYALWGLHRATTRRLDALAAHSGAPRLAVPALLALFAVDPCVPLIPLVAAAWPLGAAAAGAVVASYAAATLATMLALVLPAREGVAALRAPGLTRWGHALAGALVVAVAVAVQILGV